jgi:putative ABC transport system permease protein
VRSEPLRRIGPLLCLLSMAGCQRPVPTSAGPAVPADSYRVDNLTLASDGHTETVRGASVTPAFFQAAADQPLFGRLFTPEDYTSRAGTVVVLRHRFWRERFQSDPTWLGKTVQLNGRDYTIIGIMARTFDLPSGVDLWMPRTDSPN